MEHNTRVSAIAIRQHISPEEVVERAVKLMTELIEFEADGGKIFMERRNGAAIERTRLRIL